jgi:hypothetical protein
MTTTSIARRLALLEGLQPPSAGWTAEQEAAEWAARAERCGLTIAAVTERFRGTPGFAYALMRGEIVDPGMPRVAVGQVDAELSPMERYLAML